MKKHVNPKTLSGLSEIQRLKKRPKVIPGVILVIIGLCAALVGLLGCATSDPNEFEAAISSDIPDDPGLNAPVNQDLPRACKSLRGRK